MATTNIGSKTNDIVKTDYAAMVLKPQFTDHLQCTHPDYVTLERLPETCSYLLF